MTTTNNGATRDAGREQAEQEPARMITDLFLAELDARQVSPFIALIAVANVMISAFLAAGMDREDVQTFMERFATVAAEELK